MPSPQAHKPKINFYPTYRFRQTEKDPIIDRVRTIMEDTGYSTQDLHRGSGISATTIYNWMDGPTKRPQYASLCAAIRTMGYDFAIVPANRKGNGHGWSANDTGRYLTGGRIVKRFKSANGGGS